MELGLVGLGKMGGNMRERLRRAGHTVVGYDRNQDLSDSKDLADMVQQLPSPKVVFTTYPDPLPAQAAQCPDSKWLRPSQLRYLSTLGPAASSV